MIFNMVWHQMAWKIQIIQTLLNDCSQQLVLGANYCFCVLYSELAET